MLYCYYEIQHCQCTAAMDHGTSEDTAISLTLVYYLHTYIYEYTYGLSFATASLYIRSLTKKKKINLLTFCPLLTVKFDSVYQEYVRFKQT